MNNYTTIRGQVLSIYIVHLCIIIVHCNCEVRATPVCSMINAGQKKLIYAEHIYMHYKLYHMVSIGNIVILFRTERLQQISRSLSVLPGRLWQLLEVVARGQTLPCLVPELNTAPVFMVTSCTYWEVETAGTLSEICGVMIYVSTVLKKFYFYFG